MPMVPETMAATSGRCSHEAGAGASSISASRRAHGCGPGDGLGEGLGEGLDEGLGEGLGEELGDGDGLGEGLGAGLPPFHAKLPAASSTPSLSSVASHHIPPRPSERA